MDNIWYELNGKVDVVEDWDLSKTVAQLRKAIIAVNPSLKAVDPGTIDVYSPGVPVPIPDGIECMDPGDAVPMETSSNAKNGKGPIVVIPTMQMEEERPLKRRRSTDTTEEIDIDTLVSRLPSASSFSHGQWTKTQDCRLVYHRPKPNPSMVPVTLRLPVFARFFDNTQNQGGICIEDETMRDIEEFLTDMCASYDNERLRANRACELLQLILGVTIHPALVQAGTTDGSFLTGGAHVGFIMNLEVQNELGQGGGDPFLQNWIYQAKFWAGNRLYPGPHASFTVVLAGPCIGVCGAIATKHSVAQEWLTPLLPMNVSPLSASCTHIVRVLMALRCGITELQQLAATPTKVTELPCLELLDGDEQLAVTEPLDNRILVYRGTFGDKIVAVKIARNYCIEAHEALAQQGMAPAIVSHAVIAGWKVIAMEYIHDHQDRSDKSRMEKVVETLYACGYVHGDARPNNFLWGQDGNPFLIDFDSAGPILGKTYCQPFRNPAIRWPGPTGSQVLPSHDLQMRSVP